MDLQYLSSSKLQMLSLSLGKLYSRQVSFQTGIPYQLKGKLKQWSDFIIIIILSIPNNAQPNFIVSTVHCECCSSELAFRVNENRFPVHSKFLNQSERIIWRGRLDTDSKNQFFVFMKKC